MKLVRDDFIDDAILIGCEVEAIMAVAKVESNGGGFNAAGFPKTLFEAHHFSRLTKGKFNVSHPDLSQPKWTREFYGKTEQVESDRLNRAIALDRTAALMSTSWGMFQIMGFNHAACGFKTVQQFVNAMCKSEDAQLAAFTQFIISHNLGDELRDERWSDFARIYNGPSFSVNRYDVKMAAEYEKLKKLNAG